MADFMAMDGRIFARPGQTVKLVEDEIARVVQWQPAHVSLYELTFHQNTPLYRQWTTGHVLRPDQGLFMSLIIWAEFPLFVVFSR
jgi:coproporphyrinogen III oxidase-like Fe-S oxidoreductase